MKDARLIRKTAAVMIFRTSSGTVFSLPTKPALIYDLCNLMIAGLSVPEGQVHQHSVSGCLVGDASKHVEENKDTYDLIRVEHDPALKNLKDTPPKEDFSFLDTTTGRIVTEGSRIKLLEPWVVGLPESYTRGDVVTLERPIARALVSSEGEGWVISGGFFITNQEILNPAVCTILS